jgi:RNA polymerase sigma-70 factor (ECF subfamily)
MSIEKRLINALDRLDQSKIEDLFKEIYDSNYKLVYFCVANFIKNKLDIEEIVDDVFINFYNHVNNINIDGSIKYYLTRSAKNACINFLKKNERKEINIDTKYLENITYVELKYNDNNLFCEIKNILDEDEYNIIFNYIVMGYSLVEIASLMNVSKNTIKSKYRRALIKLKKELGGKYYE